MGLNAGASRLLEAYHGMSVDAAAMLMAAALMYAERYPRPLEVDERFEVEGAPGFDSVQAIGDVSPCGMCVIRWRDRRIIWSNNAYKQHFVDLQLRKANTGLRIDEVLPVFSESGLEAIFTSVAENGEPFHADAFRLVMPNGTVTFWDWSLSVLPTAAGDDLCLLVQMHRVPQVTLVGAA